MPVQRATLMQARTLLPYAVTDAWAMSSSVICTSTPSAAKLDRVLRQLDGGPPQPKWLRPTQSMGTPRAVKSLTMLRTPCVLASLQLSML
jgi:hypothetical protein